jgi:hypothetical protein
MRLSALLMDLLTDTDLSAGPVFFIVARRRRLVAFFGTPSHHSVSNKRCPLLLNGESAFQGDFFL